MTEAEIFKSLKAIGDEKVPGVDGYNAVFFKKAWPIIKHDIRATTEKFFDTDDLLMFARGEAQSVAALQTSFNKFTQVSGQQKNFGKSSVYFGGVTQQQEDQIMQLLGSSRAKYLSYVGRLQLIQSVSIGIKIYWAQLFAIPAKVLKIIESYCRSYLWSGGNVITKKALVVWDKVCLPKNVGGLNILSIAKWNKAVLTRLCWDIATKKDVLWIKWVHAYYIKEVDFQ
ncbi:uncharacterized protein LOC107876434 [Capsicum annuum]|uniref:uncharacterized protein LOC107876434 n=1 Tax=Capsicum annuum TaxID=4072 RepID=UPI0007BFE23F|nr:uncharacterized protein LOC107876434 [Capsicum annuum]